MVSTLGRDIWSKLENVSGKQNGRLLTNSHSLRCPQKQGTKSFESILWYPVIHFELFIIHLMSRIGKVL